MFEGLAAFCKVAHEPARPSSQSCALAEKRRPPGVVAKCWVVHLRMLARLDAGPAGIADAARPQAKTSD